MSDERLKKMPDELAKQLRAIKGQMRQEFFIRLFCKWERERRQTLLETGLFSQIDYTLKSIFFVVDQRDGDGRAKSIVRADFASLDAWREGHAWLVSRSWADWGYLEREDRDPTNAIKRALSVSEDEYFEFKLKWSGAKCVIDESPDFFAGMQHSR